MIDCEDPRICGARQHRRRENCKARARKDGHGAGAKATVVPPAPPLSVYGGSTPRVVGPYGESAQVGVRHWPSPVHADTPYLDSPDVLAFRDGAWAVDVADRGNDVYLAVEGGPGYIDFDSAQDLEDFAAVVSSVAFALDDRDDGSQSIEVHPVGPQPTSGAHASVLDDVVVHEGQEVPVYIRGRWSADAYGDTPMIPPLEDHIPAGMDLSAENLDSLARVAASAAAHLRSAGDDTDVLYHYAVPGGPLYHADSADDARDQHADGTGGGAASVQISFQGRCPNPNEPERC